MYDTVVIGAGIAGITTAYWLKEAGQKVLLLDKKGLLAGASGAAGAFLSPRLGKGGPLQQITNEAYLFALDFYSKTVPEALFRKGLARIPKDAEDSLKFKEFEKHLNIPFTLCGSEALPFVSDETMKYGALCFKESGFVDPALAAKKLTEGIETVFGVEAAPIKAGGLWKIENFRAKNVVCCTGAQRFPVDVGYLEIGGLWGERVDVKSRAEIPMTLHRRISVSANVDGVVRIGATHVKGAAGSESEIERINALIVEAIKMVPDLEDQLLLRIYAGRRSSVSDHFPVVGALADLQKAARKFNVPPKTLQPGSGEIPHIEGCYTAGCFGGRGFVFAPLMGKMLARKIVADEEVDRSVSPDRLLLRYLRRGSARSL